MAEEASSSPLSDGKVAESSTGSISEVKSTEPKVFIKDDEPSKGVSLFNTHSVNRSKAFAVPPTKLRPSICDIERKYTLKRFEPDNVKKKLVFVSTIDSLETDKEKKCDSIGSVIDAVPSSEACSSQPNTDSLETGEGKKSVSSNSVTDAIPSNEACSSQLNTDKTQLLNKFQSLTVQKSISTEKSSENTDSDKVSKYELSDLVGKISLIKLEDITQKHFTKSSNYMLARELNNITKNNPNQRKVNEEDIKNLVLKLQQKMRVSRTVQEGASNNTDANRRGVKRKRGCYFPKAALKLSMENTPVKQRGRRIVYPSTSRKSNKNNNQNERQNPVSIRSVIISNIMMYRKDADGFSKPKIYRCSVCHTMYFRVSKFLKHVRHHLMSCSKCCRCQSYFSTLKSKNKHEKICILKFAKAMRDQWGAAF